MPMTVFEAMDALPDLKERLERCVGAVVAECDRLHPQWVALKKMGAAREDHAAEMLKHVAYKLSDLETLVTRVDQIAALLVNDPYCVTRDDL